MGLIIIRRPPREPSGYGHAGVRIKTRCRTRAAAIAVRGRRTVGTPRAGG